MRIVNTAEMRALEKAWSESAQRPLIDLMEQAGKAVWDTIEKIYAPHTGAHWVVFAGSGNNGGDGYVAARYAVTAGMHVTVIHIGDPQKMTADTRTNYERFCAAGGQVTFAAGGQLPEISEVHGIVDALIGIGLTAPLRSHLLETVAAINATAKKRDCPVVAIDVPTGVNADTGNVMGDAVKASLTITIGAAKQGLRMYPARIYVGNLQVADLAMTKADFVGSTVLITEKNITWPRRTPLSHKGTQGHVAVFAGCVGMEGAALLCAKAALRAGAGKVTLFMPKNAARNVIGHIPEAMIKPVGDTDFFTLKDTEIDVSGYDAIAIGCGIGRAKETTDWGLAMTERIPCPFVCDADGLYALAQHPGHRLPARCVITPHLGEAARLLHVTNREIANDRPDYVKTLHATTGAVSVLKGASTLLFEGTRLAVNTTGNAGLATAGTGDTLTGIIAALLAQGLAPADAAATGIWWHGAAADRLAEQYGYGFLATEVADTLPYIYKEQVME
ncbi:MAG: NAD(P)H-hydrate dehydratase [Negativicoccus succinicivorans]|uniref:NAD(P)H-hydrate dehydratase n=1 Tax=Negativicoccus succinicivorans TaxID=620903 RepID=UPI002908AB36|nr:NAD(P)H-hydrate dehydratase [Negativicoccus succinicivorans]MDU5396239.1 NAD(P)H-hydrate dehydratase [Negativicoccus succinicivorans]